MSSYRLASRYSKSLLDLAIEKNMLEQVFNDVTYFKEVIKKVSEFRAILKNPEISSDKKQHIFNLLFKDFNNITQSFFSIVLRKHREEYLLEFADSFIEQYYAKKRITPVVLTTAVSPDDSTINKVKELLKNKVGLENIVLNSKVDEAILGGFKLEFDNKMIDASIHRKLEELDDQFLSNEYVKKF